MVQSAVVSKSFQSYTVNEGLLARIVEAVKQGDKDAKRTGQVRSFEIFYHGNRTDLTFGRLMVIPATVADSIEDFPSALLYGAMVRELRGETLAAVYTYGLENNEIDKYSKADLAEIKDKLFLDVDGKYKSLVMFAPTWGNVSDFKVFKYTKDVHALTTMVRHLVFAAYYDPALSSAFDRLENDPDSLDVNDITPKLNFPFLAENLLKSYPELESGDEQISKTGAVKKAHMLLAADTVDDLKDDLLLPGEKAVLDELTEELKSKVDDTIATPAEAADKQAGLVDEVAKEMDPEKYTWSEQDAEEVRERAVGVIDLVESAKMGSGKGLRARPDYGTSDLVTAAAAPQWNTDDQDRVDQTITATWKGAQGEIHLCGNGCGVKSASLADIHRHHDECSKGIHATSVLAAKKVAAKSYSWNVAPEDGIFKWEIKDIKGKRLKAKGEASTREQATKDMRTRLNELNGREGIDDFLSRTAADKETIDICPSCGKENTKWKPFTAEQWQGIFNRTWSPKLTRQCEHCKAEYPFKFIHIIRNQVASKVGSSNLLVAAETVVAKEGASLKVMTHPRDSREGMLYVAVNAKGTLDTPTKRGSRVAWLYPDKFPASFRIAVERFLKAPKAASIEKMADVPLTFDEIWGEIATDFGPAPVVELNEPKVTMEKTTEKSESKSRTEKMHERRGEDEDGKPNKIEESKPEIEAESDKEEKKPWDKESKLASADSAIGKCAFCRTSVTASTGSEVAPEQFLHQACQDKAKRAAFNMFIPGQVLSEFYPELQNETVEYPIESSSPMIENVDSKGLNSSGKYVSTDPAGNLGVGSNGQAQVLDGAPLRQETDIRGYGFNEEFYSQYENVDPMAFRAAFAVKNVRKTASIEEFRAQLTDFMKKAIGEVAATFIAAFKVTTRPMMNSIPGTGEIKLDAVEQPTGYLGFNTVNVASRVAYLISKLNDSDIQNAINEAWSQAAVWNESDNGGYNYEVFVRASSIDVDTLILKYEYVVGTKGL